MKSIAFSVLLAAVPAAAYASPSVRVADRDVPVRTYDRDRGNDADRDHAWNRGHYDRWNDSHWARDYHGRWQMVGRYFNARNDRQFINMGGARYHKLRLEAVRGEPQIDRVTLLFTNGTSQTIDLDARLENGAGEVIDLDNLGARRIRRLIVFTQPNTRGVYSVYAG